MSSHSHETSLFSLGIKLSTRSFLEVSVMAGECGTAFSFSFINLPYPFVIKLVCFLAITGCMSLKKSSITFGSSFFLITILLISYSDPMSWMPLLFLLGVVATLSFFNGSASFLEGVKLLMIFSSCGTSRSTEPASEKSEAEPSWWWLVNDWSNPFE